LKRLSEGLHAWNPQAAAARPPDDPVALLGAGWSEIVGEAIARCSRPLRVGEDAALLVVTRSSAWSQQLSLLSPQILERIAARLPQMRVERLQFRVGKIPERRAPRSAAGARPQPNESLSAGGASPERTAALRQPAASAQEAIERFKAGVTARQRAKRSAGSKECRRCGALVEAERALCVRCTNAESDERYRRVARLLFEAPWLGYAGTAERVNGLTQEEYAAIRKRLLARWWEMLTRAASSKRVTSAERSLASSYVILQSGLAPAAIVPAVIRNVLGDELHDLIYKTD
jgi:hypothetical protein